MWGRWIIIFYKHAFGIHVGKFRSFFADEIHFSGDKVGWGNKSEWSHCSSWVFGVIDVCDIGR
jgi:hypothetical protein